VTAANVNDATVFEALLDDVPAVRTPSVRRRGIRARIVRRGITARIARRGIGVGVASPGRSG
jgi:hypothetical protein